MSDAEDDVIFVHSQPLHSRVREAVVAAIQRRNYGALLQLLATKEWYGALGMMFATEPANTWTLVPQPIVTMDTCMLCGTWTDTILHVHGVDNARIGNVCDDCRLQVARVNNANALLRSILKYDAPTCSANVIDSYTCYLEEVLEY